jgi:hypothetical protein
MIDFDDSAAAGRPAAVYQERHAIDVSGLALGQELV